MMQIGELYRDKSNPENTYLLSSVDEYTKTCIGFDKKGKIKELKIETFKKRYSVIKPDYSNLEKHLIQYALQNSEVSLVLQQILRRIHPGGYFHIGDIVFGTQEIGYYTNVRRCEDLIELPLEIVDILNCAGGMAYLVMLKSLYTNRKEDKNDLICLPMYQDRYSKIDAYACLRRYNMPY